LCQACTTGRINQINTFLSVIQKHSYVFVFFSFFWVAIP